MSSKVYWPVLCICCVVVRALVLRQSSSILPVFHNVQLNHASVLDKIISRRHCCVISLCGPESLAAISALRSSKNDCLIGASCVNTGQQIRDLSEAGVRFLLAPPYDNEAFLRASSKRRMPFIGSVICTADCDKAIKQNAAGLVFKRSFNKNDNNNLPGILSHLKKHHSNSDMPMFISGGIKEEDFESYLQMNDLLNFVVDYDFARQSAEQIEIDLTQAEKKLKEVNLKLRIQRDLKNSCL